MGVQLNPDMVSRARARAAYDSMAESELHICLCPCEPASWRVIACADMLRYLGILNTEPLPGHLTFRRGRNFAFGVEVGGDPAEGYKLAFHGHYADGMDDVA